MPDKTFPAEGFTQEGPVRDGFGGVYDDLIQRNCFLPVRHQLEHPGQPQPGFPDHGRVLPVDNVLLVHFHSFPVPVVVRGVGGGLQCVLQHGPGTPAFLEVIGKVGEHSLVASVEFFNDLSRHEMELCKLALHLHSVDRLPYQAVAEDVLKLRQPVPETGLGGREKVALYGHSP